MSKKLINSEQLETAIQEQAYTGEFLGEIFLRLGYVKEEELLRVLADQFDTRFIRLADIRVDDKVLKMVPKSLVWEYKTFPLEAHSGVLTVALSNPLDMWPLSVLQERLGLIDVRFVLAQKNDILDAINKYYGDDQF
ncbi:MAG: hypothetical protein JW893_02205 [Candidatus Omnitrophica bacterium]|nr:hypothetical protein [Candidatus Omnitrophota bacterium]